MFVFQIPEVVLKQELEGHSGDFAQNSADEILPPSCKFWGLLSLAITSFRVGCEDLTEAEHNATRC